MAITQVTRPTWSINVILVVLMTHDVPPMFLTGFMTGFVTRFMTGFMIVFMTELFITRGKNL